MTWDRPRLGSIKLKMMAKDPQTKVVITNQKRNHIPQATKHLPPASFWGIYLEKAGASTFMGFPRGRKTLREAERPGSEKITSVPEKQSSRFLLK
jgi:hypothetical protein